MCAYSHVSLLWSPARKVLDSHQQKRGSGRQDRSTKRSWLRWFLGEQLFWVVKSTNLPDRIQIAFIPPHHSWAIDGTHWLHVECSKMYLNPSRIAKHVWMAGVGHIAAWYYTFSTVMVLLHGQDAQLLLKSWGFTLIMFWGSECNVLHCKLQSHPSQGDFIVTRLANVSSNMSLPVESTHAISEKKLTIVNDAQQLTMLPILFAGSLPSRSQALWLTTRCETVK